MSYKVSTLLREVRTRPPIIFGLMDNALFTDNLELVVKRIGDFGISFAVLNLNKCGLHVNNNSSDSSLNFVPLGGSDLSLTHDLWSRRIVSFISQINIDLITLELNWSLYLGVRSITLDIITFLSHESNKCDINEKIVQISRLIYSFASIQTMPTMWLLLDITDNSWNIWRTIYQMCNYSDKLKLSLKIDHVDDVALFRWLSEPIKSVIICPTEFVRSGSKFVLSDRIAQIMSKLLMYNIKVILNVSNNGLGSIYINSDVISNVPSIYPCNNINISDKNFVKDHGDFVINVNSHTINKTSNDFCNPTICEMIECIKSLNRSLDPLTLRDIYSQGYLYLLQAPLQPLIDNLDAKTYEDFELCHGKYNLYEKAIYECLCDVMAEGVSCPVLYILGAGRGHVVQRAINALNKCNITKYDIYALDKNPYTIYTLKHRLKMNESSWSNVTIIFGDMRSFAPPKSADIIVSELLGAFGDNELEPECIDEVQKLFSRCFPNSNNIRYVPESFESYAAPIRAPQLWSNLNSFDEEKRFHVQYMVGLQSYSDVLISEPKPCFYYEHPNKNLNISNDRYAQLNFLSKTDCLMHGFGGHFKCKLYKNIVFTTLPTAEDDVFSWFPTYFPINKPIMINKGDIISLHIWRKHDNSRVWYEWVFSSPSVSIVHNINGFAQYYNYN